MCFSAWVINTARTWDFNNLKKFRIYDFNCVIIKVRVLVFSNYWIEKCTVKHWKSKNVLDNAYRRHFDRLKLKLYSVCWHTEEADGDEPHVVRGGVDKSLTRQGRKKATATKLGIYSTYSPRSSTRFLARCSNFYKPLKKKIRTLSVQPGLRGSNDLRFGRKMATFQLLFQSREKVVVRRGQIRRIGWVIKTLEAQVGQFLLGCKCPVSRVIVLQEQDRLREFPAALFFQNVLQLYQKRWVMLRVDILILWKIINEEDAVLVPKDRGENSSSGFLHLEVFGAGWAAMPPLHWLLLCLRDIVI